MPDWTVAHLRQIKVPKSSSGRTSEDLVTISLFSSYIYIYIYNSDESSYLVTVPLKDISLPMVSVLILRMRSTLGKLYIDTKNSRVPLSMSNT